MVTKVEMQVDLACTSVNQESNLIPLLLPPTSPPVNAEIFTIQKCSGFDYGTVQAGLGDMRESKGFGAPL